MIRLGLVVFTFAIWVFLPEPGLRLALVAMAQETASDEAAEAEPLLSPLSIAIQQELDARIEAASSNALRERLGAIRAHYESTGFEAVWVADGRPAKRAKEVVDAIRRADEHGLKPADYDAEELFQKLGTGNETTLADLEVHLSTTLVSYAQHLNAGRVDPKAVSRENVIYPAAISPEKILGSASKTSNIKAYLRLLAPHTPRYDRLRIALGNYRRIAAAGGWPEIPAGPTLKPDMEDDRVPQLRKRLSLSGDFDGPATADGSNIYDPLLVSAVENFQKRHGLEIDGVIGPATLGEINVPIERRIEIMELNLERRRWIQNAYGPNYIFANLADQVLKVVRNEKTVFAELIQVGLPYHKTPVFSDEMEYIEINPYWNVPRSIATKELLPKLQRNPGALASQNYEVVSGGRVMNVSNVAWNSYTRVNFPFRLRQRPGANNALGRIKFMFPNQFSVYIHDTPSKSKFNRASRFFSHGCLRLNNPLQLAEVLLGEQGWDRARIDRAVASRKRQVVPLENKIPVYIAYLTAWVNKDGSVHFRRDVYERDKALANTLATVRGR